MIAFLLGTAPRALKSFIGKEVGFSILPILVLACIAGMLGDSLRAIFAGPEVSFAAVVLLGSAVDHFSRLRGMRSLFPYRLESFQRILLLLLIIAVTVFAIASLGPKLRNVVSIPAETLIYTQGLLLITAILASFLLELIEVTSEREKDEMPAWMSRYRFRKHVRGSLENSRRSLKHAHVLMKKLGPIRVSVHDPVLGSDVWYQDIPTEVENELVLIERHIERLRLNLNAFAKQEKS